MHEYLLPCHGHYDDGGGGDDQKMKFAKALRFSFTASSDRSREETEAAARVFCWQSPFKPNADIISHTERERWMEKADEGGMGGGCFGCILNHRVVCLGTHCASEWVTERMNWELFLGKCQKSLGNTGQMRSTLTWASNTRRLFRQLFDKNKMINWQLISEE